MFSEILRFPYSIVRPVYERTAFHRSVIEELENPELQRAYSICRSITKSYARTFYLAIRFLPNQKQRDIFAIYSLCRCLDNLVDEMEGKKDKNEIVDKIFEWKSNLERVYENKYWGTNPVLSAFANTLNERNIPIDFPFLLIDGIMMDLTKDRYQNFEELYDYSYKVASVVGLMVSEVFGYTDKEALSYAVDLGIAMQLTNILRDVGEDLERGRIYLPADEMNQFGVREGDLLQHKMSANFVDFMKFQIERARTYYNRAEIGIAMLSKDSRLPVYLAHINYSRILDAIVENQYQVFSRRAHLNTIQKLTALPKCFWKLKLKSAFLQKNYKLAK